MVNWPDSGSEAGIVKNARSFSSSVARPLTPSFPTISHGYGSSLAVCPDLSEILSQPSDCSPVVCAAGKDSWLVPPWQLAPAPCPPTPNSSIDRTPTQRKRQAYSDQCGGKNCGPLHCVPPYTNKKEKWIACTHRLFRFPWSHPITVESWIPRSQSPELQRSPCHRGSPYFTCSVIDRSKGIMGQRARSKKADGPLRVRAFGLPES